MNKKSISWLKYKLRFYLSGYNKNIYNIFSYFILCGFVGWIFETIVVFIRTGNMTERGLFFVNETLGVYIPFIKNIPIIRSIPLIWGLPIIPIYGIGGCIIVLTFGKIKNHSVLLFFIGMICMTIFEYFSGYFCELLLNEKYWDYSSDLINLHGRICLRSSLAWGVLSVLAVKFLKPKLEKIYTKEKKVKNYKFRLRILMVYTAFCVIVNLFFHF